MTRDLHPRPEDRNGLSLEELERESAETLPERAVMSTFTVSTMDAAAGTADAIGDGGSGTAETPPAPTEPVAAAPEVPVAEETTAVGACRDDGG